jgi:hypothetical protein
VQACASAVCESSVYLSLVTVLTYQQHQGRLVYNQVLGLGSLLSGENVGGAE